MLLIHQATSISDTLPSFEQKILCVLTLTKFISIGSYSPEVRTFATLITSTKVVRLIIFDHTPETILHLDV